MSIFDKVKKKKQNTDKEVSVAKAIQEAPPEEVLDDQLVNPQVDSSQYILQELDRDGTFAEELHSAKQYMPGLVVQVRQRESLKEDWKDWQEEAEELLREAKSRPEEDLSEEAKLQPEEDLADDEGLMDAEEPQLEPAADAEAMAFLSESRMTGFVLVLEPVGKGEELLESTIETALDEEKITFGIDEEVVNHIVEQKLYNRLFAVARGIAPVNGKDGIVTEHFSRQEEIHLTEDEKGNVDHKTLHLFRDIEEGEVICTIEHPTEGEDGRDVCGNTVPAIDGKAPKVPAGQNTVLNEDGTSLLAGTGGCLTFSGGVFKVSPLLTIQENVDTSTGNVDFSGDVLVKGDIGRGFTVKAGGSVHVKGMVEGAVIIAQEDIELEKGMNGSGGGTLEAGGTVSAHFLEQAIIRARGDVTSDTMINCDIMSEGNIIATSGKGIIIGGTLEACKSVEAKRIGNLSNTRTAIRIGCLIVDGKNAQEHTADLKDYENTIDKATKDIQYIERNPMLLKAKKDQYDELKIQKSNAEEMVKETNEKLAEIERRSAENEHSHVQGEMIYGNTDIFMRYSRVEIKEPSARCNVCYYDKELNVGTF